MITEDGIYKICDLLLRGRLPALEYCSLHTVVKIIDVPRAIEAALAHPLNKDKLLKWEKSHSEEGSDMTIETLGFKQARISRVVIKHYSQVM